MHQPGIPIAFDWTEYLNLAKEIFPDTNLNCSQDAKLRCAISRAYYAVFHKAMIKVLPGVRAKGFNSHNQVIDTLQESDDPDRRLLGVYLSNLKGKRKRADYDDSVPNLPRLAEDALIEAEELIDSFNAF